MAALPIFISHSYHDNDFCQRLLATIEPQLAPADIFYDRKDLIGGDDWITRIQAEVVARPLFLVILSGESVVAPWVHEETNLALRLAVKDPQRRIVPVLRQLCDINLLAPLLQNRQIIQCLPENEQDGFAEIVRALQHPGTLTPVIKNPAFEQARELAAQVHDTFSMGQWYEAARLGRFAVTLPGNERDAELWGEVGLALIQAGQPLEGVYALDNALAFNRYRSDLWRAKACTLVYGLQNPDEALRAWDMALVATGTPQGRFEILAEECEALNRYGRSQEALRLCDEALTLNSSSASVLTTKGDALWLLQSYDQAIACYDQALAVDPQYLAAWRGKGFTLFRQRQYADALSWFDRVLGQSPNDTVVLCHKAKALEQLNRLPDALVAIDRALALTPQDASFLADKASYLARLRQFQQAVFFLDQALVLDPRRGALYRQRGALLSELGRRDEARAAEIYAQDLGG